MSNIKSVKTKRILIVTTFCSYDPINFRKLSMDQPLQLNPRPVCKFDSITLVHRQNISFANNERILVFI